jgi:hypothetical protein
MTSRPRRALNAAGVVLFVLVLAGCTNPDASTTEKASASGGSPQNAGEQPALAPASPASQAPVDAQATPAKALAVFSRLYSNWTYRTLTHDQQVLAGMAVGAARLAEQQAVASSEADTTIARGGIWNTGQLVSIANDAARRGMWAIVTRERTGGNSQYEGLPASYHVTLARLTPVPGGFAVSEWLPQS